MTTEIDKYGLVVKGKGGDGTQNTHGRRGATFDELETEGAQPGDPCPSKESWTVFVGNLTENVTEEDLKDLFGNVDGAGKIRILLDTRNFKCLGNALVEFDNYEAAAAAITQLQGNSFIDNAPLILSFAFIVPEAKQLADDSVSRKRTSTHQLTKDDVEVDAY